MNRRTFLVGSLATLSAGSLYGLYRRAEAPLDGALLGASHEVGHLLRSGGLPPPTSERRIGVAVVGGGVSGLSVGWKLAKAGFTDFEILELEPECGGNARYGENSVSRFPWGAHYVPTPTADARAVRELFEELGVIEGYGKDGRPIYREEYLCFSPQERLFIHGRWQDGLLPLVGAKRKDLEEYDRFKDLVHDYRERRGSDGRKAFVIPMERSSRDPELFALDRLSIRELLIAKGFVSPLLHWYVDYACRDDFGCRSSDVSAWAGIHYFASRPDDSAVLTWPEGNGWLVERLRQRLAGHLRTNSLVYAIEDEKTRVSVRTFDPRERRSTRIVADAVVYAAPKHTLRHVFAGAGDLSHLDHFEYSPWLVANLTLRRIPEERTGPPLSWDNVIYTSDSLGYVVATHQTLRTHVDATVFTYYYPLAGASPAEERKRLLDTTWPSWRDFILADLSRPHAEIRDLVTRLDVFRWGHAMVRPRPGFLWGEARRRAATPIGNVYFAHSDLSGLSLFEEAQYRGVAAAEQVLDKLRVRYASSL
jgi:phytoene dehydrogenase-like protein